MDDVDEELEELRDDLTIAKSIFTLERSVVPVPTSEDNVQAGIITCMRCGCALLVDNADTFDVRRLHLDWHEANGI